MIDEERGGGDGRWRGKKMRHENVRRGCH